MVSPAIAVALPGQLGFPTDTVARYRGANHRAEFFKCSIFNAKSKPSLIAMVCSN
jgi:hypothetical protein